jgi:serine/threonine protein kinase
MKQQLHPSYSHLSPLIDNIETHFQNATRILHTARNEIRIVSFAGEDYVIKSFKIPHILNRFAYRFLRDSKAKRSYYYSLTLGDAICPAPIAYLEHFQQGLLSRSYYISRHFDYDFTLRPLFDDTAFENRQEILKKFAAFTYQLHQKGVLHRDYSPGNILIKKQEQGYQFKIIDVNRMQFKRLNLKDRLTNFARLMVDDATMKTLLYHYAHLMNKPANELFVLAINYRDQFANRRKLKNTLRGR